MWVHSTIKGEAVQLRTLVPEEAGETYLGWLNDPEITAMLEVRLNPPRSVDALAEFIAETNASEDTLLLGIFFASSDTHVGNIKIGPIDWYHRVAEIGFLIGNRAYWRRGLASEAIVLATDYAFERLEISKVTAGCYASNEGSRLALAKAGFFEEGRLIDQWRLGGRREDGLLFGRLNPALAVAF